MSALSSLRGFHSFLTEKKVFLYIYYLSIAASLVGFIYSRALLSIGQISLAAIWLLEGDLKNKVRRLGENYMALLFLGLYLIHVIGLSYTSDFVYAAEDLRIKLPLLLFPIVLSTKSLFNSRELKLLLYFFIAIVLSSTAVITIYYILNSSGISDIREASFLISHIRLALMICFSIVAAIFYIPKEKSNMQMVLLAVIIWMILFMLYFTYLTGIWILSILLLFSLAWHIRKRHWHGRTRFGVMFLLLSTFTILSIYVTEVASDFYTNNREKEVQDLPKTAGNRDYHQWYKPDEYLIRENGYLVFQNICFKEVEREWNKVSDHKVVFLDDNYDPLEDILLRFISSKGIPKDSAAVAGLSKQEIQAIENGCTNVLLMDRSRSYSRIYNTLWQYEMYKNGGNINGHTLGMRLEFWKTGWHVFKRHFWFGTGTGDIENAFQEQYEMDESQLLPRWRFRTHNQIISMAATFGIFGLLYFLLIIFLPMFVKRHYYLYMAFGLIFFLSILTEDTLETQIGVTFYALFNSLLFFQGKEESSTQ